MAYFGVILVIVGLASFKPAWMSTDILLWAIIVSSIALAPGARWLQKSEKEVPFAGAIGLFYFAWYVVPLFTRDEYEVEFITSETLIMVSAGLILMGLGWLSSSSVLKGVSLPSFEYSSRGLGALWVVGLAASFVVYWNAFNLNVGFVRSLPGVFHTFMVYAHLFGIVILTDYCWSGEVKIFRVIFAGLIVMDYLVEFNSGLLSHVLVILVAQLAWLLWRFRLSLTTVVIAGSLIIPTLVATQNVKFYFRQQVWMSDYEFSEAEKLEVWRQGFESFGNNDSFIDDSLSATASRTSAIDVYQQTRDLVPDLVPHDEDKTVLMSFLGWIPRAFWPDKPASGAGNRFGREMGLLSPDNFTTSLNTPWFADLHWSFGDLGVLFGLAIAGIVLGSLNCVINRPSMNVIDLAILIGLIWPRLIFHESAIAMAIGPLPLVISLFFLIRYWAFALSNHDGVAKGNSS